MTSARCPVCLAQVHQLVDPDGRTRTLDTATARTGIWHLNPDGTTCRPLTRTELFHGGQGHHLHQCATTGQPTLFEAGPA